MAKKVDRLKVMEDYFEDVCKVVTKAKNKKTNTIN